VLVIAADATLQFANAAAERLLGIVFSDAKGRPVESLLRDFDLCAPGADGPDWPRAVTREVEVSAPEPRVLSLYALPVKDTPQNALLVIVRDITRERAQESSLVESERLNAVRLLAASVAHEIGNPLNALNIHLQLMRRELHDAGDAAALGELLSVAQAEVGRLDAIISQFLLALRPAQPRLEPRDPAQLLQETLLLLKPDFENRRIEASLDIPAGLPALQLDPVQIKQVYFNLIKNATEAMPDGGALKISFTVMDRWLAIAFLDTGHGIPEEELARVFQPYHTTKAKGSGLGLMITQRIVQDHGGQIEVSSKSGVGACFRVLLPLADQRMRRLNPTR
ncbi:MAG: ATP-binding protein, partial [Kiritimatiellaeota bacterium]|nr:ATP-binding protein [Kiritimatiellota bacterium]